MTVYHWSTEVESSHCWVPNCPLTMEYKTNKLEPNLTAANGQRDLCYLCHLWSLVDELRESSMFYEKDMARYTRKFPAEFGVNYVCLFIGRFWSGPIRMWRILAGWFFFFSLFDNLKYVLAMTKVTFSGVSLEHNWRRKIPHTGDKASLDQCG